MEQNDPCRTFTKYGKHNNGKRDLIMQQKPVTVYLKVFFFDFFHIQSVWLLFLPVRQKTHSHFLPSRPGPENGKLWTATWFSGTLLRFWKAVFWSEHRLVKRRSNPFSTIKPVHRPGQIQCPLCTLQRHIVQIDSVAKRTKLIFIIAIIFHIFNLKLMFHIGLVCKFNSAGYFEKKESEARRKTPEYRMYSQHFNAVVTCFYQNNNCFVFTYSPRVSLIFCWPKNLFYAVDWPNRISGLLCTQRLCRFFLCCNKKDTVALVTLVNKIS